MVPDINVEVVKYKDLNKHCKVFNANMLEEFMWIHLPSETRFMEIHKLFNVTGVKETEVDISKKIGRENNHLWVRVNLDILDKTAGKKLYKLQLMDVRSDEPYNYYFTYIIQDDNPYTPYIYMKDRGNPVDPDKRKDDESEEQ